MESTTLEDYVGGLNHIYIQNIYSDESKYLSMAHIFQ
jgi:hypothetical protein